MAFQAMSGPASSFGSANGTATAMDAQYRGAQYREPSSSPVPNSSPSSVNGTTTAIDAQYGGAQYGEPSSSPISNSSSSSSNGTNTAMNAQYGGAQNRETSTSPTPNFTAPPGPSPSRKTSTTPSKVAKKRGRKPRPVGTPDEETLRHVDHLAKNRHAAARCRVKKKRQELELEERVERLQTENARIKNEINMLSKEFASLSTVARQHTGGCVRSLQTIAADALEKSGSTTGQYDSPSSSDASSSRMPSEAAKDELVSE